MARTSQRLQAPKNWIGSRGVILFKVVCDTIYLLPQMDTQLPAHTHVLGANAESNICGSIHNECNGSRLRSAKLKAITL